MSKPAEARSRLFKSGRPNIRQLNITDGEYIGGDMSILWGAYRMGAFKNMGEVDQEEFTQIVLDMLKGVYAAWMVEDKNYNFPEGYGVTGLILATFNGWQMEPVFIHFPWATNRNKLKAVVAFMQMARYEKGIGTLNINTTDETFYQHLRKRYGVVYYVGKVPKGDNGMDKFIFYGRGGSFFKRQEARA